MSCAMCETPEQRKNAFEAAKVGIDPEVINRVMKGLPVLSDGDPKVRNLRQTWSRHHTDLRH